MKTFNLSIAALATISIVSTSSADSLSESFKNGKISGVMQAYHFTRNSDTGNDYGITTLGLDLSYETALYNGFGLKGTFQAAASPWADDDAKNARYWDMYGSGAQLSEIYLSYSTGNTKAQIGRMYMSTHLLAGSGSRVNKEAVQGLIVTNSDLPDTTVTVAYVNKFQARTEVGPGWATTAQKGEFGTFKKQTTGFISKPFEDGAYTIDVTNKSIENVTLAAAYLNVVDVLKTAYVEAGYRQDSFGLSAQHYYSELDSADNASLTGIKADVTLASVNLLAAYTTVGEVSVVPGLGNGADYAYTWSEAFANQYRANQDSYKLAASYKINTNTNVGASYVLEDGKTYDNVYTAITGSYNFSGELKGLNVSLAYEMGSQDAKDDELRLRINYLF